MSIRHRASIPILAALLLVTAAVATHAQDATQSRAPDGPRDRAALVARLDSLANAPVQEGRAAGISVAVVHGRDTLLLKGYGRRTSSWTCRCRRTQCTRSAP
jgi:CubicO group peptidase (beta-lactamase class C family)